MIVSREDVYQETCKIALEMVLVLEQNVPRCARRGCIVHMGPNTLGVGGLFSQMVVVECSDWMDDGRISVYGPKDAVLHLSKRCELAGPFVVHLYYKDKYSYDCYFKSKEGTGHKLLQMHFDPRWKQSIFALFKTKMLILKKKKGKCIDSEDT